MNYRHLYHAGNFADVFKHCILILLFKSLHKKNTPILYLDTHAGIGKYDLLAEIAQKTKEYETGIGKIYNLPNCPTIIKTYQDIVHSLNTYTKTLHYYPGSPIIIRRLLRQQDYMILTELHPEDAQLLKKLFNRDKQTAVHATDGYLGLKAFLPPATGRGLVLIDPPFEEKNEFEQIISGLEIALKKFSQGVYMIWYPIKNPEEIKDFYTKLKILNCKNILTIEFSLNKNSLNSELTSCGLAIINAPWQFEVELKPIIAFLSKNLTLSETKNWCIKWLKEK
jgi:23S rRNA (adenine2030-N6)-methyltransferase